MFTNKDGRIKHERLDLKKVWVRKRQENPIKEIRGEQVTQPSIRNIYICIIDTLDI